MAAPAATTAKTCVRADTVRFAVPDPEHELVAVQLKLPLRPPADVIGYQKAPGGWWLEIPLPAVQRIEYQVEIRVPGGTWLTGLDPTNPRIVEAPFGPKSWLPMPGYTEPAWLGEPGIDGRLEPLQVTGTPDGAVELSCWVPADSTVGDRLPLLVAHDGPELARYAALTRFVAAAIAAGRLPPLRLALVSAGKARNRRYGANPAYADALVEHVLPALAKRYRLAPTPALIGVSLGGLAALHAEWTHPGTFAGLSCQSGSFFTTRTDPQEQSFARFGQVSRFVATVLATSSPPSRPAVAITAGSAEENVHNNRVLGAHLRQLGLAVGYAEIPDLHNFTCWRDGFEPQLTELLRAVWGSGGAA